MQPTGIQIVIHRMLPKCCIDNLFLTTHTVIEGTIQLLACQWEMANSQDKKAVISLPCLTGVHRSEALID